MGDNHQDDDHRILTMANRQIVRMTIMMPPVLYRFAHLRQALAGE